MNTFNKYLLSAARHQDRNWAYNAEPQNAYNSIADRNIKQSSKYRITKCENSTEEKIRWQHGFNTGL